MKKEPGGKVGRPRSTTRRSGLSSSAPLAWPAVVTRVHRGRVVRPAAGQVSPALETGVPLPKCGSGRKSSVAWPFEHMKPGQSFTLLIAETGHTRIESLINAAYVRARRMGIKITMKVNDARDAIRVWRVQ